MTSPVLCKGIDSVGDVRTLSVSTSGELNISSGGSALATEATLATLSGNVTACDTGSVTIASSALPSGASTESTLSAMSAKITTYNTGSVTIASSALPSGASTESTLSSMSAKLPASLGQKTPALSLSSVSPSASSQDSLSVATTSSDTSVSKDTSGYDSVGVIVESSASDTKAGLEWSHDNSNWFFVEQASVVSSVSPADSGTAQNCLYFKVGVLAKYVRVHVYNPDVATASVEVLSNLA